MKLAKAIEIGDLLVDDFYDSSPQDDKDALKLLIEAGKFRLRWEQQEGETEFPLLPGETKE